MKIETMWCVYDPGRRSKLIDICWRADPKSLVYDIYGTCASGSAEHMRRMVALAIYTDEAEARADAEQRLAARDAFVQSTSTGACRVWDLFDGDVRLFESGDARRWDAREERWCFWAHEDLREEMSTEDAARYAEWEATAEAWRSRPPHSPKSTGP